jgi:hypothetical protein
MPEYQPDYLPEHRQDPPTRAEAIRWHPARPGPPEPSPPAPEVLLGRVADHEHICGVGSAPRGERVRIRRCRCGQLYIWRSRGRGWRKMGWLSLILHRRKLATLSDSFEGPSDA